MLARSLAPVYARGRAVALGLLGTAIVMGLLGFRLFGDLCFSVSVLAVVLIRRRPADGRAGSAFSGLLRILTTGLFFVYCGLSAIWAYFSPRPTGNAPRPEDGKRHDRHRAARHRGGDG